MSYVPMLPELTVGENDHNHCPRCGSMNILVRVGTREFFSCNTCQHSIPEEFVETIMEAELEG